MIAITEAAREKLTRMSVERPGVMVRIFLKAGCAGVQADFNLTDHEDKFDILQRLDDKTAILIDQKSAKVLGQATLDWAGNGLGNKKFVITTPAAKTTCGCGSSFSI